MTRFIKTVYFTINAGNSQLLISRKTPTEFRADNDLDQAPALQGNSGAQFPISPAGVQYSKETASK